jgi:hypothetical protein
MPTIDRFNQYRVVIFSNDHRPAHVHVMGGEGEVVFQLQCPHGPLLLREVYRLSRRQVSDIERRLDPRHAAMCRHWRNIHGHH